jgi:Phospholipase_D-nuclease N-terminal
VRAIAAREPRAQDRRMTLLWIFVSIIAAILAIVTIVDIVQRHYSGGKTALWIVLVVIFPFVGSIAYWALRPPAPGDAEAAYLEQAELRRSGSEGRHRP